MTGKWNGEPIVQSLEAGLDRRELHIDLQHLPSTLQKMFQSADGGSVLQRQENVLRLGERQQGAAGFGIGLLRADGIAVVHDAVPFAVGDKHGSLIRGYLFENVHVKKRSGILAGEGQRAALDGLGYVFRIEARVEDHVARSRVVGNAHGGIEEHKTIYLILKLCRQQRTDKSALTAAHKVHPFAVGLGQTFRIGKHRLQILYLREHGHVRVLAAAAAEKRAAHEIIAESGIAPFYKFPGIAPGGEASHDELMAHDDDGQLFALGDVLPPADGELPPLTAEIRFSDLHFVTSDIQRGMVALIYRRFDGIHLVCIADDGNVGRGKTQEIHKLSARLHAQRTDDRCRGDKMLRDVPVAAMHTVLSDFDAFPPRVAFCLLFQLLQNDGALAPWRRMASAV